MHLESLLESALQSVPWSDNLPAYAFQQAGDLPPITEAAKADVRRQFAALPPAKLEAFQAAHGEHAPQAFVDSVHNHVNLRALSRTLELAKAVRGEG